MTLRQVGHTGQMTVLFDHFFDDAAIFPPGNAPMEIAVRAHLKALDSPLARHVGPFVCSADRLPALGDALSSVAVEALDLVLVTPIGTAPVAIATVHEEPRLRLRSVEVAGTEPGDALPEVPSGTRLLVERPLRPPFDLPPGTSLKLRTGGESAEAFPDDKSLGAAIARAVEDDLSFKLTAGLHHAVRHTDPETGFEHHGFLNVVLAVHAGLEDGDDLAAVLAERDASVVASAVAGLDEPARGRVRSHFLSFGTCSIAEPVDDLRGLGLLEAA